MMKLSLLGSGLLLTALLLTAAALPQLLTRRENLSSATAPQLTVWLWRTPVWTRTNPIRLVNTALRRRRNAVPL